MFGFITRLFKRKPAKKQLKKYNPKDVQILINGKPVSVGRMRQDTATVRQSRPSYGTSYATHQHSHDTTADHLMTAAIVHHVYSDPSPSESHCTRSYHEVDTSSSCDSSSSYSCSSSSDSGGSWD